MFSTAFVGAAAAAAAVAARRYWRTEPEPPPDPHEIVERTIAWTGVWPNRYGLRDQVLRYCQRCPVAVTVVERRRWLISRFTARVRGERQYVDPLYLLMLLWPMLRRVGASPEKLLSETYVDAMGQTIWP